MKILTVTQVSELIQAKPSTIYAWAGQSQIPCFKINGLLRFEEGEIFAWLTDCKRPDARYNTSIQVRGPKKGGKR
jgi:predicted DNA-binding transcriptional regulator AlpA